MGFLYSQLFVTPAIPTTPLPGQTIIITGSNTGLGFEAAVHIARLDPARLILAVRNVEAGEKARTEIIATTGCAPSVVQVWHVDLASFASVLSFTDRVAKDLDRLDGISLNAGISTELFSLAEGYERSITINVISTFLMAVAVLPKLRETARKYAVRPRLSIVSSETHAWAAFPEKNTTPPDESILKALSDPVAKATNQRYMTSKLVQVLVFRHLAPIVAAQSSAVPTTTTTTTTMTKKDRNAEVVFNILNPGLAHSDIGREPNMVFTIVKALLARTREKGGRPIAAGVVAGLESDGMYMHDGVVDQGALSAYVLSDEGAKCGERLWLELKEIYEGLRKGITAGL